MCEGWRVIVIVVVVAVIIMSITAFGRKWGSEALLPVIAAFEE